MPDIKYPALAETFAVEFKSGPDNTASNYTFTHRYVRSFSNMSLTVGGAAQTFTALPELDFKMKDGLAGGVKDEKFVITIDSDTLPIKNRIAGQFADIECFVYQVDRDAENAEAGPTATLLQHGFLRQLTVRAKGDPGITECEFSSVKAVMEDYPIGVTASNLCGWRFGDTSCNATVHSYSATVSSVSDNQVTLAITGTSNGLTIADAFARDLFFNNGFITVEGLNLSIRSLASGTSSAAVFNLYNPAPASTTYTWVGKTGTITEGCNKGYDTCGLKVNSLDGQMNNHRHFGGFGIRMPAFNPQTDPASVSPQGLARASEVRALINQKSSGTSSVSLTKEWTPASISPSAWYQASALSGTDGSSVPSWVDSSGNGFTASQLISARQPTLQTRELNNQSVVRFDGTNDILSDSDIAALDVGTGDIFMAAVFKSTDDSSAQFFFEKNNTEFGLMTTAAGVLQARMGGTTNIPTQSAGNWSRTDYVIVTAKRVSSTCTGFVNGTAMTTTNTTNTGSISNSNVFDLGAASVGGQAMTGDLAEVVVGGAQLSEADRLRLEGYLAHKYGLQTNLPNTHTYRFKAP